MTCTTSIGLSVSIFHQETKNKLLEFSTGPDATRADPTRPAVNPTRGHLWFSEVSNICKVTL